MSDTRSPSIAAPPGGDTSASDTPAWVAGDPDVSRHGAIARRLFTYSNYKNWADKVRGAWDDPVATTTARDPRR